MMTIATPRHESASSNTKRTALFAQNWLHGADVGRSARRRLAAILRNACRTLGLKRRSGLGMLGIGGRLAGAVVVTVMMTGVFGGAYANDGIFINDGTDDGCTIISDANGDPKTTITLKGATSTDGGLTGGTKITNVQRGEIAALSTDAVTGSQLFETETKVTNVDNRVTNIDGRVTTIETTISSIEANEALRWDATNGVFTARRGQLGGEFALGEDAPIDINKIEDVAAGDVNATSTDAINGSQLYKVEQAGVKYKLNEDGTKTNEVALVGGDPSAPVVISNVATGKAPMDAVNVQQLTTSIADVKTSTLTESKTYTDQKFNNLSGDISSVRNEARQAAAIGLAASSLRFDSAPGKISVAMGGGVWRDQAAVAFGAGYTSETGKVRANLSGVASGGEVGVGAGMSFTLN